MLHVGTQISSNGHPKVGVRLLETHLSERSVHSVARVRGSCDTVRERCERLDLETLHQISGVIPNRRIVEGRTSGGVQVWRPGPVMGHVVAIGRNAVLCDEVRGKEGRGYAHQPEGMILLYRGLNGLTVLTRIALVVNVVRKSEFSPVDTPRRIDERKVGLHAGHHRGKITGQRPTLGGYRRNIDVLRGHSRGSLSYATRARGTDRGGTQLQRWRRCRWGVVACRHLLSCRSSSEAISCTDCRCQGHNGGQHRNHRSPNRIRTHRTHLGGCAGASPF